MILIPAIDIKEGRCVRLRQGEMDAVTVYSDNLVDMARHWQNEGASRLHIVDLDGAIAGHPVHADLIKKMIASVSIPVEVGGGLRSMEAIHDYLAAGAGWVVLGTSLLSSASLVFDAARSFPMRIIAGIDCKKGYVATRGWVAVSETTPIDLARTMPHDQVAAIILTDIEKDGMMEGPNFTLYQSVAEAVTIPIIASGGITTTEDIHRLHQIKGVAGAIMGKALYSGAISYGDAMRCLTTKADDAG